MPVQDARNAPPTQDWTALYRDRHRAERAARGKSAARTKFPWLVCPFLGCVFSLKSECDVKVGAFVFGVGIIQWVAHFVGYQSGTSPDFCLVCFSLCTTLVLICKFLSLLRDHGLHCGGERRENEIIN